MSYVTSRIGLPKLFLLFFILPLLSYLGGVLFLSPHITQAAGNTYYVVTTNLFFPQEGVVTSIVLSYAESPLLQL
jgi:hypothetical protein